MSYAREFLPSNTSHLDSAAYTAPHSHQLMSNASELTSPVLTQFGEFVDVRKRGALRIMRTVDTQLGRKVDTPAVVRIWHEEHCRELNAHQARALANQLLAAAELAENQNNMV